MRVLSIAGTFRNLMDIFPYIPVDKQAKDFRAKGAKMVNDRTKLGKSREDIFSHLLGEDSETGTKFTPQQLRANALLLIVAGSDTTSTVLSNLFRELALRPDLQQRVYDEVHEAAQAAGPDRLNCENTKGLPYLQAVIDETLRLWNPVPSGPQTQTGPEGATIAGRFIPPNTTVRVHNLTLMTGKPPPTSTLYSL